MDTRRQNKFNENDMNNFLSEKGILDSRVSQNNRSIRECVAVLSNKSNNINEEITLKFPSESYLYKILKSMSVSDLLNIKFHNSDNKIIDDFFDSITQG